MGKTKKGFNWKARERIETVVDNSSLKQIVLEDDRFTKQNYDGSNLLVLPSQKRVTKKKKVNNGVTRILSKTQRKKLEKVISKKKKKEDRTELLEKLAQVQATEEQLNQLTSITSIQTTGLKRSINYIEQVSKTDNLTKGIKVVDSLSGRKRRKLLNDDTNRLKNVTKDVNVVGFDQSDTSSDSDSDHDDDVEVSPVPEVEIKEEICEPENNDIPVVEAEVQSTKPAPVKSTEPVKSKPAVYVHVDRTEQVQEARLKLPILAEEQTIMEVINDNNVVVVAGETGSGKTTQIPQFLYEAGYARDKMIGVTEPRRVAAVSMSTRVAHEMNLTNKQVSYLIRFEGNCTDKTRIKFMTDGVLLKEVQTDFLLTKYSAIILDEAHERSVHTDILIGLLSRIVPLRNKRGLPLKLIIMSATLRVEDFTDNLKLFKTPPPVVKVDSRQFPVTIHFNKRTSDNYLLECYRKTCRIHTELPAGGILIFVTGQQEVNTLVKKLRKTFPYVRATRTEENQQEGEEEEENEEEDGWEKKIRRKRKKLVRLPEVNLDKYSVMPEDDTEADLLEDDEEDEDENWDGLVNDVIMKNISEPMWVLPLYSLLSSAKQAKVFSSPPEGCRLCVVSTNIAETSLTIPGIKYVVDCGRTKSRLYDKVTGVSTYHVTWCSKAAANQRAGRAGRLSPGHCYRLYSSAVYNDVFQQFSEPEIKQKPVDDLLLQMKSMNIVKVVNFPFPTSPDLLQLRVAERRLKILGALTESNNKDDEWNSKLTSLGETMSCFPVSPRFSKMLALSQQQHLLDYTLCIVAALSVPQLLLDGNNEDSNWCVMRRKWAGTGNSLLLGDPMVLLRAVGAAEYSRDKLEEFCQRNGLRHKAVIEVRKLRIQLTNQICSSVPGVNLGVDPNMKPPTDEQARLLRQIVLSGMADQVAHRIDLDQVKEEDKSKMKRGYQCCEMEEPVFMNKNCVLSKQLPEWVVYQEVYQTNKIYMRGVTAVEPEWLPVFAPSLCNLSDPLEEPPPRYDSATGRVVCHVSGTFGKAAFPLPTTEIPLISGLASYKWFSKFLLDGTVFTALKKFTPSLLSSPSCMTKSWARLQPRTEVLLNALAAKDVNTKDKLLDLWRNDQSYLLQAYKQWLPESAHSDLTLMWPPVG